MHEQASEHDNPGQPGQRIEGNPHLVAPLLAPPGWLDFSMAIGTAVKERPDGENNS
jgi:hypothetical protein